MSLNIDLNKNVEECDEDVDVYVDENLIDVEEGVDEKDKVLEPYIDMEFVSHEEAKSFYLKYAKFIGFGAAIKTSRRSKASKEFIDVKFACTRHGKKQVYDASNPRSCFKMDCKATLHVKRMKDHKWVVHNFIKEHNHELCPNYAHYLPCHRSISSMDKSSIDNLHAVGVKTSKIFAAMAKRHGGYESIGFMEKDVRNLLDKERRLELASGDAKAMLEHFMHMQEENPNFFYAMDLDENQRLKNVFWVDAKGREDYKIFGDVVSFDTTYITNKYKMPFAPFIGVNNHLQSILLGCALLADETTSTFVWLMQTWVRAMGGKPPTSILTDQDKAMKSAIAKVFPNSRHRFCLWHILKKVPEKLSHVIKKHEDFIRVFNRCVKYSWTCEDFERRWWDLIERFELQKDEWLASLFEDRLHWVPAYMRDTFFAGMSTTQRSESINSFFDKYVNKKTALKEFVEQYKVALQDRYEKEAQADFNTRHKEPSLKSPSPFEKQMSIVYTHEVLKKFQVEVLGVGGCYALKESEDNMSKTFKVQDFEKKYEFMVVWDARKYEIYCFCHLFEYMGFLCRHAMSVLQSLGIFHIPSHYILERWTKSVKSIYTIKHIPEDLKSKKQRFDGLFQEATKLSTEGSISQESFDIAYLAMKEALKKCAMANQYLKTPENLTCELHDGENVHAVSMLDPQVSKTKGAPKRIKSGIEIKDTRKKKVHKNIGLPNRMEGSCPNAASDGIPFHVWNLEGNEI